MICSLGFERLPSLSIALDSLAKNIRPSQKLILFSTFPIIDKNPLKLNNGYLKKNPYLFEKKYNNTNKIIFEKLASKYPNVFVYDLSKSEIFINAPYINDTVAYFDKFHINNFGAIKLAKDLDSDFIKFLNVNNIK